MLTVFAVPKPFTAPFDLIQEQAIASWVALGARVILIGDEEGIDAAAARHDATHIATIERNDYGTPRLDSAFSAARQASDDPVLCFANCDIILPHALAAAVAHLSSAHTNFLLVGRCVDVDPANATQPDAAGAGPVRGHDFLDWFVFSRDLFRNLPPFVLGRAGFDNWLVWHARQAGAAVIDASDAFLAIHQRHAHSHLVGGTTWAYSGPEAQANIALAGGRRHLFTMLDATHRLTTDGMIVARRGATFRLSHRFHQARLFAGRAKARLGA